MQLLTLFTVSCLFTKAICMHFPERSGGRHGNSLVKREDPPHGPFRLLDCDNRQKALIDDGLQVAKDMLDKTAARLETLHDNYGLITHYGLSVKEVSGELASAFQTYRVLIDKLALTRSEERDENEDDMTAMDILVTLINRARRVRHQLQYRPYHIPPTNSLTANVEFRCGTTWLTDLDRYGRPPSPDPPDPYSHLLFDNRIGARDYKWCNVTNGTFEHPINLSGRESMMIFTKASEPYSNVIAFNPNSLNYRWDPSRNPAMITWDQIQIDLGHHTLGIPEGMRNIAPLPPLIDQHLSTHILSVALRLPSLYGRYPGLLSTCRGQMNSLEYWKCALEIVEKGANAALLEEGNYLFLVIAMYLDKHDWSLGYMRDPWEAKEMGPRPLPGQEEWSTEPLDWYQLQRMDEMQGDGMDGDDPMDK